MEQARLGMEEKSKCEGYSTEVSVIIATYKRNESLKKALESLKEQTFRDFEIIVVDDNNNQYFIDKVYRIVSHFKQYSNIKCTLLSDGTNRGSAAARNKGISMAQGEYITFLDDDDMYLPKKIENQVIAMKREEIDFSITNLNLYNEDNKLIESRTREYIVNKDDKELLIYHLKYHITGTDAMMFKKDYLLRIGGFDSIDVGDEFYLMLKAILAKGKFKYIPICDIKAYIHNSGGLSSGESKIQGENLLFDFKKRYFELLENKDIRYVKMRHHAVLAFAYLRMKKWYKFFQETILSFFSQPIECCKLIKGLRK